MKRALFVLLLLALMAAEEAAIVGLVVTVAMISRCAR